MKILLEVELLEKVEHAVEIELHEDATVETAAKQLAAILGFLEADELLEDLRVGEIALERTHRIGDYSQHGNRWCHKRDWIDLHFEADSKRHHFPARAKWARVHRWGCEVFHVGPDLRANLELREGSPSGPVLNEHLPIGHFDGCKVVWLVKPGPEPYGVSDQLDVDLRSPEFLHGVQQEFWRFHSRDRNQIFVELTAMDDQTYLIRLDCEDYGNEPIDGKFVDPVTKLCTSEAWPQGNEVFAQWVKFSGTDNFICWDQDRSGIAHHSDWRPRKSWTKEKNQLFRYLDFVRRLLNLTSLGYQPLLDKKAA